MIVVVGRVQTDEAHRADAIRIGETVAAASRTEAGCLSYRVHQATDDPDALVFVEEWADQGALEAHFATDHVNRFLKDILGQLTAPPDVKFHTIASTVDFADLQAAG
jgi:quinol monooxygenase YgiN